SCLVSRAVFDSDFYLFSYKHCIFVQQKKKKTLGRPWSLPLPFKIKVLNLPASSALVPAPQRRNRQPWSVTAPLSVPATGVKVAPVWEKPGPGSRYFPPPPLWTLPPRSHEAEGEEAAAGRGAAHSRSPLPAERGAVVSVPGPSVRQLARHGRSARHPRHTGNGEQGKAFPLTDADQVDQAYRENGFNIFVSDRISLNRSVPDIRHPK
uniref:Polypeptide N-acetylgalactosaminyltransferase 10 n=1 Tax=Oryzias latipes TaxID=8090 RepID=A0A3P9JE34_ORYLA